MNKLLRVAVGLALMLSVLVHGQASLTGKWQGTTGQGRQVSLDLKADGEQLTGTFTLDGQSVAIADGKIAKTAFSFKAAMGDQTVTFTGEIVGDEIALTHQGAENAVTLKRVK